MLKNLPASAGDGGSIPGWERSPGGEDGSPLQHSYLENPMDRGARGYSPWGRSVRRHGVTERGRWRKTPILKLCCFRVCPPGGDLSKETETQISFLGNSCNFNVCWAVLAGLALYWILKRISLCLQGAYQALFSKVLWFRPFFSLLIQSLCIP